MWYIEPIYYTQYFIFKVYYFMVNSKHWGHFQGKFLPDFMGTELNTDYLGSFSYSLFSYLLLFL